MIRSATYHDDIISRCGIISIGTYEAASLTSRTPYLDRLRYESERLQVLLISEVLSCETLESCSDAIGHLIRTGEELLRYRSHHALMLVTFCLQSHSVFQLKSAWALLQESMTARWRRLECTVGGGGSLLVNEVMRSAVGHEQCDRNHLQRVRLFLPECPQVTSATQVIRISH